MLVSGNSCSIKEDREACPCFLTVVRPDSEAGLQGDVFWFLAAGEYSIEGKIEEGETEYCDIEVPRTVLRLIAVSGIQDGLSIEGGLRIEEGKDCPPVYYYRTDLDTRCNSLRDTLQLHKNYSRISIQGNLSLDYSYMLASLYKHFIFDFITLLFNYLFISYKELNVCYETSILILHYHF